MYSKKYYASTRTNPSLDSKTSQDIKIISISFNSFLCKNYILRILKKNERPLTSKNMLSRKWVKISKYVIQAFTQQI